MLTNIVIFFIKIDNIAILYWAYKIFCSVPKEELWLQKEELTEEQKQALGDLNFRIRPYVQFVNLQWEQVETILNWV